MPEVTIQQAGGADGAESSSAPLPWASGSSPDLLLRGMQRVAFNETEETVLTTAEYKITPQTLCDPTLSRGARLTLSILAHHADHEGVVRAATSTILGSCGVSPGVLRRDFKELAGRGMIRLEKSGRSVNIQIVGGVPGVDLPSERVPFKRKGISDTVREKVVKHSGSRCAYCGKIAKPPTVDHILPLSRGGTNHEKNLVVACKQCNMEKGDRTVSEYRIFLRARRGNAPF